MSETLGPRPRRSRLAIAGLAVVALLVLFAIFLGGVTLFDWTESTDFCSSCHVMKPEVTAYRSSPHARVDCGTCHIGPGALPAVQAKLASVRYVWEYPTGKYPRPIPSPITSLRPVEVVCEQCHWPQKTYEDRFAILNRYAPDEKNSLTQIALRLHTGGAASAAGPSRGIHWHIDNPVYYIATDDTRQNIPWVQAEYQGVKTEYLSTDSTLTAEQIASAEKRKMDCVDCHNRATHVFREPGDALDSSMANGSIAADLPEIKKQGLAALDKTYASEDEARTAIAAIPDYYRTTYPDIYAKREADIKAAATAIQGIFDTIQFPFMQVGPDTHPNNIGHKDFPGCFRCHDGKHLSQDKQAIRLECNICHAIPQEAAPGQTLKPIAVSNTPEPDSHHSTTWLAEHRYQFDDSCAGCHDVSNPGGTDNSGFCSNGACHGTEWKYAGLNAPQVRALGAPPKSQGTGEARAVPHPVGNNTDCKVCHGPDKVRPFPENHSAYTVDMCTGCHRPPTQESTQPTSTAQPAAAATQSPAGDAQGSMPAIPHEVAGREKCLTCHSPEGGLKPAPKDHAGRGEDTCQGCHKPASAQTAAGDAAPAATQEAAERPTAAASGGSTPAIPHEIAGREKCLTCHNPEGGMKPAPADHKGRTEDNCQLCHQAAS